MISPPVKLRKMLDNPENEPKTVFTVQQPSKVNQIETSKSTAGGSSIFLSIVKCVLTGIMIAGFLLSLVASKLSLVSIGQHINLTNKTYKQLEKECGTKNHASCDKTEETAFVMLVLTLMIPQGLTFFRSLKNSAFCSNQPWPSKTATVWGIGASILEVLGICLFIVAIVAGEQDASRVVVLMNGIFLAPVIWQGWKECLRVKRKQQQTRISEDGYYAFPAHDDDDDGDSIFKSTCVNVTLFIFSGIFGIVGMCFGIYLADNSLRERISVPLFMILVSIAWCPKLRKLQIMAKKSPELDKTVQDDLFYQSEDYVLVDWQKIRVKTARERMTVISSFTKLLLTPFVAALFSHSFKLIDIGRVSKGFEHFSDNSHLLNMFIVQIVCSLVGQILGWLGCTMGLQKSCFAVPLILSTPLSVALVLTKGCVDMKFYPCFNDANDKLYETIILAFLLWLSQIFSTTIYVWKSQQFLMAKEETLFWVPTYDGVLLEQHLLLNRKNEVTDEYYINYRNLVKESVIYICTTMYHEADFEMEQLLTSLSGVDREREACKRQFEAHVWFDDGARGQVVKWYALQLLSLLPKTMNVKAGDAMKLETPYGLQLKWRLPGGMPFVLHLKDNHKVKNKKRWSQVMYMSYVLDFKQDRTKDDLTYILTTDADVRFTPDDVMALMDLMSRNPKVGAVCGRTHPMGSGPLVWYQIFDYAVGHWLLKAAEDVLGSVLCSPGCFSVYRARALRDILPIYSSGIDSAMDFLTKDMGEDRWLCTLMVEAGWRLEFCATAENSTYCPDNFDEFFKQRRRWNPSTVANQVLLVNDSGMIRQNNDEINFFFVIYQVIVMMSSIIGPSTVILIIAGGLEYAYPGSISLIGMLVVQLVIVILFTIICYKTSQDFQLQTAKILTFLFAIVMSITIVGIILQMSQDIRAYIHRQDILALLAKPTSSAKPVGNHTVVTSTPLTVPPKKELLFLPSTWYMIMLVGLFFFTSLLHGIEVMYLIHGLWYLLCLPSGYLFLTIYSVANLTDRSWGTREAKGPKAEEENSWAVMKKYFKQICWCCVPPSMRPEAKEPGERQRLIQDSKSSYGSISDTDSIESDTEVGETSDTSKKTYQQEDLSDYSQEDTDSITSLISLSEGPAGDEPRAQLGSKAVLPDAPKKSALKKRGATKRQKPQAGHGSQSLLSRDGSFRFPGQSKVTFAPNMPHLYSAMSVEEFLTGSYREYIPNFKNNGYDNVSFIVGMKEKDLLEIQITNRGHRKRILALILALPPEEIEQEVPEDVEEWLMKLGLEEYWPRFKENSYSEPKDLADLKFMDKETLRNTFGIEKEGHLRKFTQAVQKLQYPTAAQIMIREARKDIEKVTCKNLQKDNGDDGSEHEFWVSLKTICLLPEQAAFSQSEELKFKLGELRDLSLAVLAVANVLWLTFMVTVMYQGKKLAIFGTSFASVAFLIVYTVILIFQVIAMLVHRFETGVHSLARTPFSPGKYHRNWSFHDDDLPKEPDPEMLDAIRRRRKRSRNSSESSRNDSRALSPDPLKQGLLSSQNIA